ncbi:MAG TPA: hypothetical protein VGC28_10160 [Sphingomonas sp.]
MHDSLDGIQPFPIEYKRGRSKAHHTYEVQLCAQAICPEEMFGRAAIEGRSGGIRRPLRTLTIETAA